MFASFRKASGLSLAFIVAATVGAGGTSVSAVGAEAAEDVIESIIITGSRIKRNDRSSISPITVLTAEDFSVSGNLTLENFIQDLPSVTGGDYGAGVNNGNPGVASVSLRGLGPNRTLVLVNGKRFASQGVNGFVDLNAIPSAIVERIEVMRDGASTIYGTDAVAGVVNIITKKNFEGVELEYGYDVTDEDDGEMHNFSATFGNTFEKGNFVLSAQVNKRDEIRQGDRGYSACPFFDDGNRKICGGSGTTTPAAFTPLGINGVLGSQVLDADGFTTRDFDPARDSYNYAAESYLTTPQDVYSAYAAVNYQLIEDSAFGSLGSSLEMNYSNRSSDQLLAPVGTFGGWVTSASHPNNPFGDALCAGNPDCDTPQGVATARRLTESGGRRFTQEVNTWRISLGLDGEFNNGWTWDANYTVAKWLDSQRDEGRPNRPAIEAMMDPDLCAAAGDCPGIFNPFISNSMTPDQVAYGFVGVNTKDYSKLNIFQANLSGGTGIDLPGGEISWAVGFENRREEASSSPDGGAAIGAIAFTPGNVTGGRFEVDEYYAEVVLPILQGAPMAEILAVEVSGRYTDVDFLSGGDSIFKVAVEWAPVEDIRFRATFAEGFRAPNISELFLGQQQSAETYTDPCRNYGTSGTDANTVANCQADGLPGDFNLATFQATTLQGGNPDLEPETSESFTFGIIFTPSFVENLVVTLDYYDIEIENAVGSAPTSEVISACYASAGFSDPLCALIVGPAYPGVDETPSPLAPSRRNTVNQLSGILATTANLATYNTSGYDFQVNYGFETSMGMVSLKAGGTYLDEYDYIPYTGGDKVSLAGNFGGDPAFGSPAAFANLQMNYSATLTQDNWGANLSAKYMDSTEDVGAAPGNLENTAADVTYFDAQGYFIWQDITFTVGVRNLTDEEPSYVTAYDDMNTLQYSYDTQGRYYYTRAKMSF